MEKELKQAKKENKEILEWLKAIDLISADKERMDEVAIIERAGTYQIFWKTYFSKDLARILDSQKQYMAENVETEGQILWLRGVIAGLDIVKRYFEDQNNLALEKFNKESSELIQ